MTATTFAPDAPITREPLTVLVARAMNSYTPSQPLQAHFTDAAHIGAWALPYAMQAAEANIVHGLTNCALDPLGLAARAQATGMVGNLITITGQ